MRATKFCYRCRKYFVRDAFPVIKHGGNVYKLARNCQPCHDIKTALAAVHAKKNKLFKPCALRERELALIPNPFEKMATVQIEDKSHLLWSEVIA